MSDRVQENGAASVSMTDSLSKRVNLITQSPAAAMAARARKLKAAGHDVINLSIGEPDFDTPEDIKRAAWDALAAGYTKYSPIAGIPALRDAIAARLKRDNGLDYTPDEIVVSNGAKQAITNTCLAFLNPGDEVIVFSPFWGAYSSVIRLAGAQQVSVPTRDGDSYRFNIDALAAAMTDRTKLIIINSPSNPSGMVYSRGDLEAMIALLRSYPRVWILSDEIYDSILFEGVYTSPASLPGGFERTVTINGLSKAYAMTGWRVGYAAAPAPIAAKLSLMQGVLTAGVNSFVQHAAVFALNEMDDARRAMRDSYLRRRDVLIELLLAIPKIRVSIPAGAFYVFPDVSAYFGKEYDGQHIRDCDDLVGYLLNDALVAVTSGVSFGDPDCVRISFAASMDEIRQGVARIAEALDRL